MNACRSSIGGDGRRGKEEVTVKKRRRLYCTCKGLGLEVKRHKAATALFFFDFLRHKF